MKSIQALRERRNVLAQSVHEMLEKNEGDKWNKDLQAKYDASMSELEDIGAEAKRVQDYLDKVADSAEFQAIGQTLEKKAKDEGKPYLAAFWKLMRNGDRALSREEWEIYQTYTKGIVNTMSVGTAGQGGYTVPIEVAASVAEALKAYGGMRKVAETFRTTAGNDINYPTSDGTGEVGEIIGENTTATGLDPSFGVVTLKTYKFSSKVIAVPFEMLQDSAIDVEAFIRKRIVTRLGRIQNTKFTLGSGTGEPLGLISAISLGKAGLTGQTTTVIYDDLVDLVHSVDPAYRESGSCGFMMADTSLRNLRKLKDTTGRPIFMPGYDGLGGAMPDTVLGYPITINQDMAAMAANAKSIAFGDFSYYKIRDVMELTLFRFDDSAYIKLGQVGFLAWARAGGTYVDVGSAVKYYQNSAT